VRREFATRIDLARDQVFRTYANFGKAGKAA
jgi:hypothetical protein